MQTSKPMQTLSNFLELGEYPEDFLPMILSAWCQHNGQNSKKKIH